MTTDPLAAHVDAVARLGVQRAALHRLQAGMPGAVERLVEARGTLDTLERKAGGLWRLVGIAPERSDIEAARDDVDTAEDEVDDLKRRIRDGERATAEYDRDR